MPRKPKPPPSRDRIRELLDYDPSSGVFMWKVSRGSGGAIFRVDAGSIAGGRTTNGYVTIGIDGTPFLAHRLAWLYYFGEWPNEIDHRDRDRSNNSILNLRAVSHSQNSLNTSTRIGTKSGIKGVAPKKNNRWRAYITLDGKQINLGHFGTKAEAALARSKAEGACLATRSCYLSGAMRGVPNLNRPAFAKYAEKLRAEGWVVFNPAAANLEGWPLRKILEHELGWICREAEAIALIPGYENSEGVAAELATAIALGLEVIEL